MDCGDLPCLPGLDALGRGFDLKLGTGDGRLNIFAFDEAGSSAFKTYINPQNSSLVYYHPGSVQVIDNTRTTEAAVSNSFFTTEEYRQSLTESVSAGVEYMGFGASVDVSHASSVLDDSKKYGSIAETETRVTLYDATVAPGDAPLSDYFNTQLEKLSKNASMATDAEFFSFFAQFGTHFISSATFGGKGKMSTSVGWSYASHSTSEDISVQAKAHYKYVQAGASYSKETDESDTEFRENSDFEITMLGGDTQLGLSDWNEWLKTFYNSPALVSFKVRPISDLVDPPALAEAIFNKSVAYVGQGIGACATSDAQLSRSNRKLACIQALMDTECCSYLTIEGRYGASMKCNCGSDVDLRPWGSPIQKCHKKATASGCQAYGSHDHAPPKMAFLADIQKCLSML